MTDTSNQKPIRVLTAGIWGSYMSIPFSQLEQVRELLREHEISHWVDHHAISVNGRPAMIVINLSRKTDPVRVQELLDAV